MADASNPPPVDRGSGGSLFSRRPLLTSEGRQVSPGHRTPAASQQILPKNPHSLSWL